MQSLKSHRNNFLNTLKWLTCLAKVFSQNPFCTPATLFACSSIDLTWMFLGCNLCWSFLLPLISLGCSWLQLMLKFPTSRSLLVVLGCNLCWSFLLPLISLGCSWLQLMLKLPTSIDLTWLFFFATYAEVSYFHWSHLVVLVCNLCWSFLLPLISLGCSWLQLMLKFPTFTWLKNFVYL